VYRHGSFVLANVIHQGCFRLNCAIRKFRSLAPSERVNQIARLGGATRTLAASLPVTTRACPDGELITRQRRDVARPLREGCSALYFSEALRLQSQEFITLACFRAMVAPLYSTHKRGDAWLRSPKPRKARTESQVKKLGQCRSAGQLALLRIHANRSRRLINVRKILDATRSINGPPVCSSQFVLKAVQ
jgi:hypothetical protein